MLHPSRIYSFLHKNKRFSFHLIDGQKIIADLAAMHNFSSGSLHYLRDTLLSSLLFERLLKSGENLGFYIDSQDPFFKFKLELSHNGKFRTLILPSNLTSIPNHFTGYARINKILAGQNAPYTSIIEVEKEKTSEIFNKLLKQSYQDNSISYISSVSDQSLLISKLPSDPKNPDEELDALAPQDFLKENLDMFTNFFSKPDQSLASIVEYFKESQFDYLSSKALEFECPCNRDHYLSSMRNLDSKTKNEICQESQIDVTCDYCLSAFSYSKEEILN